MAQRQGRRSLGLAPLPGIPSKSDGGLTDLQKFEDFRRRHSKQNREIILDNAQRKSTIKELQDEIESLHTEILSIQQINLKLQVKIKRIQNQNQMNGSKQIHEALNQLILVFPALKQLRDNLSISNQNSHHEDECDVGRTKNNRYNLSNGTVENNYATRPAELARQNHVLWCLDEQSENGSGCESERGLDKVEIRKVRRQSRSHGTPIGSVASSRSPRRSYQNSPKVSYVEIASPSSSKASASPSPKKTSSTSSSSSSAPVLTSSSTKKQRKRRESGLIIPQPRSPSPEPQLPITANENIGQVPQWEESTGNEPSNETILNREDITMPQDIASPPVIPTVGIISPRKVEVLDTIKEVSSSDGGSGSSSSRQHNTSITPVEEMINEEEGIGRGRRSRSSINYKEPSLSKKMRKPDGIATEEVLPITSTSLKPNSRRSIASNAPLSSSSSRPTTPPKNDGRGANSTSPGSPLSPLPAHEVQSSKPKPTRATSASSKQNGMRRKSTLPKAGNNQHNKKSLVDQEDEDDVDDLVELGLDIGGGGYKDDLENVELRTKNLLLNSPMKGKENKSSTSDIIEDNVISSKSVRSTTTNKSSYKPTPSSSNSSKTSSSSLGLGRPIMPPSSNPTSSSSSTNNKPITSNSITTTRNFTPTARSISNTSKKSEQDVLQEGGTTLNIPSLPRQSRHMMDKQKLSISGNTTASSTKPTRRMSSAV